MGIAPGDELVWSVRLVLAAVAGAIIGFERELHAHPAGMRTHLLVSVGAAAFTILSMHGFADVAGEPDVTLDPSRVAAQIVSGIGFIGGGAILKYGVSIRGLTTAGSLWATAAVGFAFGSGMLIVGTAAASIILFSLWPLHALLRRVRPERKDESRVRLGMTRLETLGAVYDCLVAEHVAIASIGSQRLGKGRYEVDLRLQLPQRIRQADLEARLASLEDVEVLESAEVY
ncbi:MAG: MgtC/SapB family protein [Chloroflexi bacterium]|nr:MgtC/SapB family protein [Chloroflexota bacterium]